MEVLGPTRDAETLSHKRKHTTTKDWREADSGQVLQNDGDCSQKTEDRPDAGKGAPTKEQHCRQHD